MFIQCSQVKVLVVFVGLVFFNRCLLSCDGTVVAKSKINLCVNDNRRDPYNVVEGKKCDKKLVITKAVTAGESASELMYINISTVEDQVDRDQARLYYPFIVTVTKSPMKLVYPYKLIEIANNKPYETSRRHYWCTDGAEASDDELSCPIRRDKTTNERIWDSQGFCCRCSYWEDLEWNGAGNRYHRGSTECGNKLNLPIFSWLFKNDDRQSSHCMHYDDLWYEVHSIDTYRLYFEVYVKAFELVEMEQSGKIKQKLVDAGTITLSNFKKSGHGKYGRILATLIGTFEPNTQFSSLTEKYLMMPSRSSRVQHTKHVQTRGGFRDYLLIPKSFCAFGTELNSCDKIGVGFTAFRQQGGESGHGTGCTRKMGSCLNNQLKDYFMEDLKRREKGKRPFYFPDKYGELVGTQQLGAKSDKFALVYKVNQIVASTVTLEISADDMILIYNKATGSIVKAIANNFESLSRDGAIHIIVQNTGLVTADFFVTINFCTVGILRSVEQKASINPQATHIFQLQLRTTVHTASDFMCTVQLWDARYKYLDAANVTFTTTKSCVCLQSCTCACTDTTDADRTVCVSKPREEEEQEPLKNIKLKKRKLSSLQAFFMRVNNDLTSITMVVTKPTLARSLNAWVFFCLLFGLFKAKLGIRRGGGPIAYFGWWWELPEGKEVFVDKNGNETLGVYDKDGDLKDPVTGTVLKSEKQLLFVGNIFFFFLLICLLGVRAARFYKKLEEREEVTVSLSGVALAGTTVYRNFKNIPDVDTYLTNPGTEFSIAGKLEQINLDYKFIIVDKMQVIEVVEDELLLLTPAVPFNDEVFTTVFDQETALTEITLQPMYVCLNEEPTLDYYSEEDEEQLPPTPPIPDYSFHGQPQSSSIYVSPFPNN